MKIAIDAMGGDFAPLEIVLGALEAVRETEHIDVVLVGDKTQIFKIEEDTFYNRMYVIDQDNQKSELSEDEMNMIKSKRNQ